MKFTRTAIVAGAVAALVAAGTIGYAAIPSSDGSVKVCYAKAGSLVGAKGAARVVDNSEACKTTETAVTVASAAAVAALQTRVTNLESTVRDILRPVISLLMTGTFNDGTQYHGYTWTAKGSQLKPGSTVKASYPNTTVGGDGDVSYATVDADGFFEISGGATCQFSPVIRVEGIALDGSPVAKEQKGTGC